MVEISHSEDIPWQVAVHPREGLLEAKLLFEDDLGDNRQFSLSLLRFGEAENSWRTPRHRHTFEQIRYAVDRPLNYAIDKFIPVGCFGFFPVGAYYGPQHYDGGVQLLLQYGRGYLSSAQKKEAQAELSRTGHFHDGKYTYVDTRSGVSQTVDGLNAQWEHVYGKKLVFPTPANPEPVVIQPDGYEWRAAGTGVSRKALGTYGHDLASISLLRLTGVASCSVDPTSTRLVFVISGAPTVNSRAAGAGTAIFCRSSEELVLASSATALVYSFPA